MSATELVVDHDAIVANEWVVISTALLEGALILVCAETGAYGIVREPTKAEWSEAFHAPSNPYRWRGGDDRVEVLPLPKKANAVLREKAIAAMRRQVSIERAQSK